MVDLSKDGIITLSRGDTVQFPIFLNTGSDLEPVRYDLLEYDELYMAIMEPNQPFENAIVKKKFTMNSPKDQNGLTIIRLNHDDTKCLLPDKYFYQIKLRKYNELYQDYDVMTVVDKTLFWIQE